MPAADLAAFRAEPDLAGSASRPRRTIVRELDAALHDPAIGLDALARGHGPGPPAHRHARRRRRSATAPRPSTRGWPTARSRGHRRRRPRRPPQPRRGAASRAVRPGCARRRTRGTSRSASGYHRPMTDLVPAPADNRPYSPGLEGVIAGETALSYIDGEARRAAVPRLPHRRAGQGAGSYARGRGAAVDRRVGPGREARLPARARTPC